MTGQGVHIPVLTTKRLILRAPRIADFEAYAAFRADPVATKFFGGPFARDVAWDQFGEIAGHWLLRGFGRWMVADRATDAPLGVVGLYFPDGWPEPEIAWSVFPAAEGRGIAFEAAQAARRHAYDTLGWTTAVSVIAPANTRSEALARRLGARPEGVFAHRDLGPLPLWRHPSPAELAA